MIKMIRFEWLHFSRNPSRLLALLLFVLAGTFGLYTGITNYAERQNQIQAIGETMETSQNQIYEWFEQGKSGPEERPWVDINTPFWSMWYANHHLVHSPPATMIFNLGQSQHFGYYKRVSMWTSAFDDDLIAEIANAELVRFGSLDFSFVWLYLMPLLLTILIYPLGGLEYDLGLMSLLKSQRASVSSWLMIRLSIIGLGLFAVLTFFLFVPVLFISDVLVGEVVSLWMIYSLYLLLWLLIGYIVLLFGNGQADQALKMVGMWLLLTVAIPGIVSQYVLLKKPADLMMDMIEASRDGQEEIYGKSRKEIVQESIRMVPEVASMDIARHDSLLSQDMINAAYRLVLNRYKSSVSNEINDDQLERNQLISSFDWINPVTAFQNWLNSNTNTGHEANINFRKRIQSAGEKINYRLLVDEWSDKRMNRSHFEEYIGLFDFDKLKSESGPKELSLDE
jgi:ABC-2 type transport system permease protein